ncbi:unnamed protein product, partial [Phaeothamnion confervicola]
MATTSYDLPQMPPLPPRSMGEGANSAIAGAHVASSGSQGRAVILSFLPAATKAGLAAAMTALSWGTFFLWGRTGLVYFVVWLAAHAYFYGVLELQARKVLLDCFASHLRGDDPAAAAAAAAGEQAAPTLEEAVVWLLERIRTDGRRVNVPGIGVDATSKRLSTTPARLRSAEVRPGSDSRSIRASGAANGNGRRNLGRESELEGGGASFSAAFGSGATTRETSPPTDVAAAAVRANASDDWLVGTGIDSDDDDDDDFASIPIRPANGVRRAQLSGTAASSGAAALAAATAAGRAALRHPSRPRSRAGSGASIGVYSSSGGSGGGCGARSMSTPTSRAGSRANSWHEGEGAGGGATYAGTMVVQRGGPGQNGGGGDRAIVSNIGGAAAGGGGRGTRCGGSNAATSGSSLSAATSASSLARGMGGSVNGGSSGSIAAAAAAATAAAGGWDDGEGASAMEEFDLEVAGCSQLLRRTTTLFQSEEQQMVQELLAAVNDAPKAPGGTTPAAAAVLPGGAGIGVGTPGGSAASTFPTIGPYPSINGAGAGGVAGAAVVGGAAPGGGWSLVRDRRGIQVWTSPVPDSPWYRIRARMRCEATPQQLLSLLIDDTRIGEYDRMFDRIRLVERVDDRTSVRWSSYRALWPTRPRDFVIKSTWEEFGDGTVVLATRSVERPDCPENPIFVRGRMVMCGYVISPREVC